MDKGKLLLINPGHDDEVAGNKARSVGARSRAVPREDPPVSLLNLGAYVRDKGYDVSILDTHVETGYREKLLEHIKQKPLAIGLSVILGKFTKNAISLTRFIKEHAPDMPVIWGGKIVHLAQDMILTDLPVDYIVVGEGEFSLPSLLEAIAEGREPSGIPGVGYMKDGKPVVDKDFKYAHELDSIYTSVDFGWDLVKQHVNRKQQPYFINLYSSRGCKYNCSFCYLKDIKQVGTVHRYRRRSAANVIKEIEYLNSNFGITVFTFGDDDFLFELNEVRPVLDHMRKKNYFIEHIWTNINNLNTETIEMVSGLCQTICYSVETSSPRLQRILRKTIPIEKVLNTNRALREAGINTVHNFLFGIPTETDDETKMNVDLMKEMKVVNPHVRANCYILSPIPGTPIFDYAQEVAGKTIPWGMDDLAEFHFMFMQESSMKFRPYLSPEDNHFYERVAMLSDTLFTELNQAPSQEILDEIAASERLGHIFGDISGIPRPEGRERKYILDKVLKAQDEGTDLPRLERF